MKKILLMLLVLSITTPVFAGGIGYIDYEQVFENYAYAKKSAQEIEAKGAEIRQYLAKKEEEFKKIESPVQKKKFEETVQAELKVKENAFNVFRNKREEEVYTRIHAVSEKIRLEKKYDVILDRRSVFSGGEDITKPLIDKLNENQR